MPNNASSRRNIKRQRLQEGAPPRGNSTGGAAKPDIYKRINYSLNHQLPYNAAATGTGADGAAAAAAATAATPAAGAAGAGVSSPAIQQVIGGGERKGRKRGGGPAESSKVRRRPSDERERASGGDEDISSITPRPSAHDPRRAMRT
jgi:hypothetical protein